MRDEEETRDPARELASLRRRVAGLEVSEQKLRRVEEELRESEKRLFAALDSINALVVIEDKDYNILFENKALREVFGGRVGSKCYESYIGRDSPCPVCPVKEILHGDRTEFTYHPEAGGRNFESRASKLRNPDGSYSVIEVLTDITERRQAEEAIRRMSVSRLLVSRMLHDLRVEGDLSEGAMFRAGKALAASVEADTLPGFLEAFADMGLGTLALVDVDEERRRWTFTGEGLVEHSPGSQKPTSNYTRGFLCGAIDKVAGAARVAAVELACQSMGDEACRIVVQVLV